LKFESKRFGVDACNEVGIQFFRQHISLVIVYKINRGHFGMCVQVEHIFAQVAAAGVVDAPRIKYHRYGAIMVDQAAVFDEYFINAQ